MAYSDRGIKGSLGEQETVSTGGYSSRGIKKKSAISVAPKQDLSTLEGLQEYARTQGADLPPEEPKLGALQRLGAGLGAFNPAEAIATGMERGLGKGLLEYPKNIVQGLGTAITGTNYEDDRRTFKDIARKAGIRNGYAQFGIGFLGDVLLDPTTYFGGAIAKGVIGTTKAVGGKALTTVGKVSPELETGVKMVGEGLQDALGRAFAYGHKATEGAREGVLTFLSKKQKAQLALAADNLDRLGTGAMTPDQRTELALKMVTGKRAEFVLGEKVSEDAVATVNKLFPDMKVKDADHAEKVLAGLEDATSKQVEGIRARVEELVRPFFTARQKAVKAGKTIEGSGVQTTPALGSFSKVDDLNRVISGLKAQLKELRAGRVATATTKTVDDLGGAITREESVAAHNSLIKYEEQRLMEVVDDLSRKIELAAKGGKVGVKGDKVAQMTPEELVVYAERKIKKLQNDLADKARLLTTATRGRVTGSGLIKEARETGDWSKIEKIAPGLVDDLKLGSDDILVQQKLDEQLVRGKQFAAEANIENPYETYFPFIKNTKLEKFLKQTEGIKVGSEDYRKQFKNLLTNENMELDPAKAFFTRESQIVSDKMTRTFLNDFVRDYGKPLTEFKNLDEATAAGYRVIKEKGFYGKELGYIKEWDEKLLRDSISPEFATLNILAKATGFDAVTSLFKRSVTGLFLPFHIRNYVSGTIQNFEVLGKDALDPRNMAIGQKIAYLIAKGDDMPEGIITVAGKEMPLKEIMKPFLDRFSGDTFYNTDFSMALASGDQLKQVSGILSKQRIKETVKTVGLGQEAIPFKLARTVGQFIEHQQKATAYVTALGQGRSVESALKLAEAAGFDYRALTKFESQIMRRIIPFYSYTRKNAELQLRTLGENPQRINQVLAFFDNVGGEQLSEEEKKGLPDYLKEQIITGFGRNKLGQPIVIGSFGTPLEQPGQSYLGKTPGESIMKMVTTLNPIIKAPLENALGKDFFQNRPIDEIVDAKQYQKIPEPLKEFIDFREVKKKTKDGKEYTAYTADPEKLHILRNLPTSRLFGYLYEIYRPESEISEAGRVLKLTTGVKLAPIDLETVAYFRERDKKRELENLLIRYGVLKEFKNTYIPKEK